MSLVNYASSDSDSDSEGAAAPVLPDDRPARAKKEAGKSIFVPPVSIAKAQEAAAEESTAGKSNTGRSSAQGKKRALGLASLLPPPKHSRAAAAETSAGRSHGAASGDRAQHDSPLVDASSSDGAAIALGPLSAAPLPAGAATEPRPPSSASTVAAASTAVQHTEDATAYTYESAYHASTTALQGYEQGGRSTGSYQDATAPVDDVPAAFAGRGFDASSVSFVDVSADDVHGHNTAIEMIDPETKAKMERNRASAPTGRQKSKHQITWLLHHARANEEKVQLNTSTARSAMQNARGRYGW